MDGSGSIRECGSWGKFRKDRDRVRELIKDGFVEVFVDTPLKVCETRDVKGMYKKARAGEIKGFTGVGAPYEAPQNPEIVLPTVNLSVDDCVSQLIGYLNL